MRLNSISQKIAKPIGMRHKNPLVYIERAKVSVSNNEVVATSVKGEQVIPVAVTGALLLGPGTSITSEAMKIAARRECCILWTGGGGMPIHSFSGNYKSPKNLINQTKILLNKKVRLDKAKILLAKRNEFLEEDMPKLDLNEIREAKDIENLTLVEARWAKRLYRYQNTKYNIYKNDRIKLANFMCYGLVTPILIAMGLNPNIGLIHGLTRGGGLVFDIADLIKPVSSVVQSCIAEKENLDNNDLKRLIIRSYKDNNFHSKIIDVVSDLWLGL